LQKMRRYKPKNQLSFESFKTPFDRHLNRENKWVKLAQTIPWDECAAIYLKSLSVHTGRPGLDARLAVGALLIKHMKGLSDRGVVEELSENLYLQYFVGYSSFNPNAAFDASLFVTLRKRMGPDRFDEMNELIISRALGLENKDEGGDEGGDEEKRKELDKKGQQVVENKRPKPEKEPKHKGRLKVDVTVSDQMIVYPTDVSLLNQSREELERLIDQLYKASERQVKPRTYRRVARGRYLALAMKKQKRKQALRKTIGQQLNYVRRNIRIINELWDEIEDIRGVLSYRDVKLFWVIQHVYAQQKKMHREKTKSHPWRIVNLYQPYVRPMPRGKDKAATEFGSQLGVSEFDGFCRLDHLSWEAYHEGKHDLVMQVERYKKLKGYYPEVVLCDGKYLSRENRRWLKSKHIRHVGKSLGRAKKLSAYLKRKLKMERGMRNHIEGKFGQGKNGYELNRIRAKRQDTSESWISAIFLVMNLVRWNKILAVLLLILYHWAVFIAVFIPDRKQALPQMKGRIKKGRWINMDLGLPT